MESIVRIIRLAAWRLAVDDPNDDPQELFNQVLPLLKSMTINGITDSKETLLIIGKSRGKDSMYCITLRRDAEITMKIINNIKKEEKSFISLVWSSKAIQIYVWWPYIPPEETTAPGTPGIPKK